MSQDARKLCVNCAWRAQCTRRFNRGDNATLHCPDFTEDVGLRKPVDPRSATEGGTQ